MSDEPKFKFPEFHAQFPGSEPLEDLIPKMVGKYHLTMLSGEAYTGKTRLALQMAHALAQGIAFFWKTPMPQQKVVYFTERSTASVKRDAMDRCLDMSGIVVVSILELPDEEYAEYEANRTKWLKAVLIKHKANIAFLDTFGHFMPSYANGKGGMNDYGTMGRACRELQRMCLKLKVTMFLIHHYAKEREGQGYKSFKQRSSGTTSIAGNTLSMWGLEMAGPVDENSGHSDYLMLSCLYHHSSQPDPIYFKSAENGLLLVVDHDAVVQAMMPKERVTRKEQVLSMIPDNTDVSKDELLDRCVNELKISRTHAYNLVSTMLKEGFLTLEKTIDDSVRLSKRKPQ